jgi:hypothetical protein
LFDVFYIFFPYSFLYLTGEVQFFPQHTLSYYWHYIAYSLLWTSMVCSKHIIWFLTLYWKKKLNIFHSLSTLIVIWKYIK